MKLKTASTIKRNMRKSGLNQSELAKNIGVTRAYMTLILKHGTISFEILKKICDALDIELEEIESSMVDDYKTELKHKWEELG